MKNTFGQAVALTIFGESHGPAVGAVLDGLAPGLPVDEDYIRRSWPAAVPPRRWIRHGRSRTAIRYSAACTRAAPPVRR